MSSINPPVKSDAFEKEFFERQENLKKKQNLAQSDLDEMRQFVNQKAPEAAKPHYNGAIDQMEDVLKNSPKGEEEATNQATAAPQESGPKFMTLIEKFLQLLQEAHQRYLNGEPFSPKANQLFDKVKEKAREVASDIHERAVGKADLTAGGEDNPQLQNMREEFVEVSQRYTTKEVAEQAFDKAFNPNEPGMQNVKRADFRDRLKQATKEVSDNIENGRDSYNAQMRSQAGSWESRIFKPQEQTAAANVQPTAQATAANQAANRPAPVPQPNAGAANQAQAVNQAQPKAAANPQPGQPQPSAAVNPQPGQPRPNAAVNPQARPQPQPNAAANPQAAQVQPKPEVKPGSRPPQRPLPELKQKGKQPGDPNIVTEGLQEQMMAGLDTLNRDVRDVRQDSFAGSRGAQNNVQALTPANMRQLRTEFGLEAQRKGIEFGAAEKAFNQRFDFDAYSQGKPTFMTKDDIAQKLNEAKQDIRGHDMDLNRVQDSLNTNANDQARNDLQNKADNRQTVQQQRASTNAAQSKFMQGQPEVDAPKAPHSK